MVYKILSNLVILIKKQRIVGLECKYTRRHNSVTNLRDGDHREEQEVKTNSALS
jgi:hypothetical protein